MMMVGKKISGTARARIAFHLSLLVCVFALCLCVPLQVHAQAPKAQAGNLIFAGALPGKILVIDEPSMQVIDEIKLETGIPRKLVLSTDKKKLYVYTVKENGVEVVDLLTRKVTNHFLLSEGTRKLWVQGFTPDPQDRFIYITFTASEKKLDRFEIEKPKFGVVDLALKKIVKTVDFPKDQDNVFNLFAGYRVSPDGKFLFVFRDSVFVYDTQDFKQVDKIELSKPMLPWMETLRVGAAGDPHDEPGIVTALFNATDPVVHREIFGIARVDLTNRTFDFTPVGPSVYAGMYGLRLTPDRKTGYTVTLFGGEGNMRAELWAFDMDTRKLVRRNEFPAPISFNFTLSGDGKQLYIHGSTARIDVYDAATLELKKSVDLNTDLTTGLVMLPAGSATSASARGQ
jgi:DNA-binding beta-propeller fold protein YncE